jgi:hypothetical protein
MWSFINLHISRFLHTKTFCKQKEVSYSIYKNRYSRQDYFESLVRAPEHLWADYWNACPSSRWLPQTWTPCIRTNLYELLTLKPNIGLLLVLIWSTGCFWNFSPSWRACCNVIQLLYLTCKANLNMQTSLYKYRLTGRNRALTTAHVENGRHRRLLLRLTIAATVLALIRQPILVCCASGLMRLEL